MESLEATIDQMTARQRATMLAALKYWKREGRLSYGIERDIAEQAGPALTGYELDQLVQLVDDVPDSKIVTLLRDVAELLPHAARLHPDDLRELQGRVVEAVRIAGGAA